jgi:protein-L-isoaspartate(D-aspartate) O-methyltransferase
VAVAEPDAQRRNEELVGQLEASGTLRDPTIAGAFRAVLRHHFLPGRPLDEVYEDSAILTKTGAHGLPVSSSSQPAIMAIMLQQLQLKPGQRVLEIGAGTGYNAALMAHLTRPDGHVVTLDVDAELCQQARANLAGAGATGVEVVHADGAGGWPAGAPYHRIILTVGADDISPAWLDQLTEDGRLVLPLGLGGIAQMSVTFIRRGRRLVSSELSPCGFMTLRGEMAPAEPTPWERARGFDDWLRRPGRPTGHVVPARDLGAGFETWLCVTQDSTVRARPRPDDAPALGLEDESGLALLVGEGDDLAITVFAEGERAAERLAAAHQEWTLARPDLDHLEVEAVPNAELDSGVRHQEVVVRATTGPRTARVVARPRFSFFVRQT